MPIVRSHCSTSSGHRPTGRLVAAARTHDRPSRSCAARRERRPFSAPCSSSANPRRRPHDHPRSAGEKSAACRRDRDVRTMAQVRRVAGGAALILVRPQVAGIDGDGEVRTAAQPVRCVDRGVKSASRSRCSPPPPGTRRLKTRSRRPCEGRCATRRRAARTSPNVLCASSSDGVVQRMVVRPAIALPDIRPMLGTRYFSSTQVTPLDVSQSHISVPSRSIARPWKPPPGNTHHGPRCSSRLGAYTVIVGRLTLRGRPLASRFPGPADRLVGRRSGPDRNLRLAWRRLPDGGAARSQVAWRPGERDPAKRDERAKTPPGENGVAPQIHSCANLPRIGPQRRSPVSVPTRQRIRTQPEHEENLGLSPCAPRSP